MQYSVQLSLSNEQDTQILAQILAQQIAQGVVYLIGDLGAGKTTLTRYWLQQLGHHGAVKSPTYTLVEPYEIKGKNIFHFDLYRLNDPYELELMGIRDYLEVENALFLFEWPSRGGEEIPQADVILNLLKTEHEDVRDVIIELNDTVLYAQLQDHYS